MLLQYFGFVINFQKGDIPPLGSGSPSRLHCVHHYSLLEISDAIEAKIYGLLDILTCIKEYLQHVDKNAFQWDAYRPPVDRMWGGGYLPGMGDVCPGGCLPRGLCHVTYPIMHLMLLVCCLHTD